MVLHSPIFVLAVALQTKFSLSSKFRAILGVCQRRLHMFFRPRGSTRPGSSWKALGGLREYGLDSRLLLAVKSLYSCSEVCVRVGGVKSQLFTICAGLQEGCVLSPLLFIFRLNWIDSRSRVEEGVTVGSCKINRLLFLDDLVFLASSQKTSASPRSVFCCVRPSRNKN